MEQDGMEIDRSLVRPPAVAGIFYPSTPKELAATVQFYLSQAAEKFGDAKLISPKAIIAPHAGYVYSGLTAAAGYNSLRSRANKITRVVMMGPCHRVGISGLALPSHKLSARRSATFRWTWMQQPKLCILTRLKFTMKRTKKIIH